MNNEEYDREQVINEYIKKHGGNAYNALDIALQEIDTLKKLINDMNEDLAGEDI